MKNNVRSILGIMGILLLSILAVSCKESPKDNMSTTRSGVDSTRSNGNSKTLNVRNNADDVVMAYLNLKNALMEEENVSTQKLARRLILAFKEFDENGFSGEEQKELREILDNAIEQSTHISGSDLVHQREHFVAVSEDVLELIAIAGTRKTLYQDFCPMYNDGKGAVWISETKAIKNPYYGAGKMLDCGSIQEVIN